MVLLIMTSIIAFVAVLFVTRVVKALAFKHGICSTPNHRSVHQKVTPLLGGVAIFVAFMFSFIIVLIFSDDGLHALISELSVFLAAGFLVLLLGVYDDIRGAYWYEKLAVEFLAGMIIILFGYKISVIINPLGGTISLGVFSVPFTLLWIVGITNAINLIDGLDGLAAGISFGAACVMVFVSLWFGNLASAFPAAILAASLAGFLIFNFNPAKIFLGDSGSLFLGFMLACFSINGTFRDSSAVAILIPIIVLGIPITDTLLALWRRLRKHVNPFVADKEHIHHRLLQLGLNHRQAVLLIYSVSYLWGIAAIIIFISHTLFNLILMFLIFVSLVWGLKRLGFGQYFLVNQKNK